VSLLREAVNKIPRARDGSGRPQMTFDIEEAAQRFAEFIHEKRHLLTTDQGEREMLSNQKIAELINVPARLVELWMRPLRHQ
jgi:hypothetical protein